MADPRPIVLVHGAWHGPSAWDKVVGPLRERGHDVHALKLPSSGPDPSALGDMYDDAAMVRETVDALGADVLVVAHSYGGIPTTEGLAGAGNVSHILYLTSFMLDEGESLFATVGNEQPDWWDRSEDGRATVVKRAGEIFYNDCSPEDAAAASAGLEPQSFESFVQPVRAVAWRGLPATYVICDRDNAIPVFAQEQLSQRAGDVRRLAASHSPFLSMPEQVVEIVAELAG